MAAMLHLENLFHHQNRQVRVFRRKTNPLEEFPDQNIIEKFRFSPDGIAFLTELLEEDLLRVTGRTQSLSVETQILIALRYYATGGFLELIGEGFGVNKGTVSRVVRDVSDALANQLDNFVKWPSNRQERNHVKQGFIEMGGFPNVIGCVDGTHVEVQGPSTPANYPARDAEGNELPSYEAAFVNRMQYHSINVQGICDSNCKFKAQIYFSK